MRLRKKWWARPELEESSLFIIDPRSNKGNWKQEFNNNNKLYLELGCGRGKFIAENAKLNPSINYIGIDIKDEVLIYALKKLEEAEVTNARITALNIMFVEELFEKGEINRIYINFCNPWPKERHNKRRLTHSKFLSFYKKFLKENGEVWFKTDDVGLFEDSKNYFLESGFELKYVTDDLHNSDFAENICTEYEEKFTELGMKTMFLIGKLK